MTKTRTVEPGETLVGIAFSEGFRSWETVWNRPENEALREKRDSPDILYAGDEVFIPDITPKSVSIDAFQPDSDDAQQYTFVVKAPKLHLSFSLEDESGQLYKNKQYVMVVSTAEASQEIEGETTDDGLVTAAIAPDALSLTLTLWPDGNDKSNPVKWAFQLGATAEQTVDPTP